MFNISPYLALAIVLVGIIGAMLSGCGSMSPSLDLRQGQLREGAWNIKPDIGLSKFKVNFSRSF